MNEASGRGLPYCSEHFMVVRVSQSTFSRPSYRCPYCGQKDDVLRVFLQDVLDTLLYEPGHVGARKCKIATPIAVPGRK